MTYVCLYFQVHQPYRLRSDYHFFDIGGTHEYLDEGLNQMILERVAARCYVPALTRLLELVLRYRGAFKVSFSIRV